jgi:hypothetical protein
MFRKVTLLVAVLVAHLTPALAQPPFPLPFPPLPMPQGTPRVRYYSFNYRSRRGLLGNRVRIQQQAVCPDCPQ